MPGKYFAILDERKSWAADAIGTAKKRGYTTKHLSPGNVATWPEGPIDGLGFIRPHAQPLILKRNQLVDDPQMRLRFSHMVQDPAQVQVYENKSEQFRRWHDVMPPTWRFENCDEAYAFLDRAPYPLVSKADVGASSYNVRILNDRAAARAHVYRIFHGGIEVKHCAGGDGTRDTIGMQCGYVLLQEFIPHEITWRVNCIGSALAVFMRRNYPDRNVAQTGNTKAAMAIDDRIGSLLHYARGIRDQVLSTRWCALDILWDAYRERWWLIETSLAWPWNSRDYSDAPFFGSNRKWGEMWDLMFDEYERGVWSPS